jgi:hypothetical protein
MRCHVVIVTYWDWYLANIHVRVNRNNEIRSTAVSFIHIANCKIHRLHSLVNGDSQAFWGLTQCRLVSNYEQSKAVPSSQKVC